MLFFDKMNSANQSQVVKHVIALAVPLHISMISPSKCQASMHHTVTFFTRLGVFPVASSAL